MSEILRNLLHKEELLSSYAATLDLFVNALKDKTHDIQEFTDFVAYDLRHARNSEQKTLNLWLMGLTKKGLDNIVRDES